MTIFPLLAVSFIMNVVMVLFIICSVVLILIILIQKGKGGGLSGAFGGGAVSGILGSKAKEPLTWFTVFLVVVFMTFAIIMAKFYKPTISDFGEGQAQRPLVQQEQPQGSKQPSLPVVTRDANTGTGSLGD